MSEAEKPERLARGKATIEDIDQLMGASTPHFALQIRERIRKLIMNLPPNDPAWLAGTREMQRLGRLAIVGEDRGRNAEPDERPLPSLHRFEP